MLGKYIGNITILAVIAGIGLLLVSHAKANEVGNQYYPTATENISSVKGMKTEHQLKTQRMEVEYKQKMAALDKRYKEKTLNKEAYTNKMIELRENAAALKEERMAKRAEQDQALLERKEKLENIEFEKINPYVLATKERKAYFAKKNNNSTKTAAK